MRSPNDRTSTENAADPKEAADLLEPVEEGAPEQAAIPPIVDPNRFEPFEGFRETTLACFLDKKANAAIRATGRLLYSMVLEYWQFWPEEPEGSFRHSVRAVIADMRHIQGYLANLGREREASSLPPLEAHLSRKCPGLAARIKEIADALEKELGPWRGEE
jgi:hypothetical protein